MHSGTSGDGLASLEGYTATSFARSTCFRLRKLEGAYVKFTTTISTLVCTNAPYGRFTASLIAAIVPHAPTLSGVTTHHDFRTHDKDFAGVSDLP